MRLPPHLLFSLGLAAACEPAYEGDGKPTEQANVDEAKPLDEEVRLRAAVAPRYEPLQQPHPNPSKQPLVKKKPKPRKVVTSDCGHLVDEGSLAVPCGKG